MFKVETDSLYSLTELEAHLYGLVSIATFLERLGLREHRVFRDAVWGWEIIDAARKAHSFSERGHLQAIEAHSILSLKSSRKTKSADSPAGKLSAWDL